MNPSETIHEIKSIIGNDDPALCLAVVPRREPMKIRRRFNRLFIVLTVFLVWRGLKPNRFADWRP